MFWDEISGVYDLFEDIYNRSVYRKTGQEAARLLKAEDHVLECACGTGAISVYLVQKCAWLTATDCSENMLKQAKKKLSAYPNVTTAQADITKLSYADNSFDAVVAGNVIHLLPEPEQAVRELMRVCSPGGRLIIPTYINGSGKTNQTVVGLLNKLGANFKRWFDEDSYRRFFESMGMTDVQYILVDGKMPCDIAVITVKK